MSGFVTMLRVGSRRYSDQKLRMLAADKIEELEEELRVSLNEQVELMERKEQLNNERLAQIEVLQKERNDALWQNLHDLKYTRRYTTDEEIDAAVKMVEGWSDTPEWYAAGWNCLYVLFPGIRRCGGCADCEDPYVELLQERLGERIIRCNGKGWVIGGENE